MYGVNGPLGLGVRRATYLIDGSRRVRDVLLADFKIGRHEEFVRKAVMLRAAATH
jgi:peroxiredoxin